VQRRSFLAMIASAGAGLLLKTAAPSARQRAPATVLYLNTVTTAPAQVDDELEYTDSQATPAAQLQTLADRNLHAGGVQYAG
jgi:hypothetical protein